VPVWDSELGENAGGNPAGKTFTLFKLPPRYPAFPDSAAGGQQYADTCAAYGLQAIGCSPTFHGYIYINSVTPHGMGMPSSWGCNSVRALHAKTGGRSVAALQSHAWMYGVDVNGNQISTPEAGYAPVCALAH
jgi:hypothetical protein